MQTEFGSAHNFTLRSALRVIGRAGFSVGWAASLALGLAACLVACGGGTTPALQAPVPTVAAQRPVAVAEMPALHQCLTRINQVLRDDPSQKKLSLECLEGTYAGLTPKGDPCLLRVDAARKRFDFDYGPEHVEVEWADVAIGPDGRPVHNLEASPLGQDQPGVQISRFSPVPVAVTQVVALRAGAPVTGPRGLPHLSYLRVAADTTTEVKCRFGA